MFVVHVRCWMACLAFLTLFSPVALGEEQVLTNAEVVKMVSAGLGDSLVISKFRQAHEVDFALEVGDLIELKSSGVGEEVVEAMLKRSNSSVFGLTTASTSSNPRFVSSALAAKPLGFSVDS